MKKHFVRVCGVCWVEIGLEQGVEQGVGEGFGRGKSFYFSVTFPASSIEIEKKGAFLLKIAVLLVKIEKLNKTKNNFPMILLAIILLPLKYPI